MLTVTSGHRSDVGRVRHHNEDSVLVGQRLWAVADGMGGHAAGDIASALVIEGLRPLDEKDDLLNVRTIGGGEYRSDGFRLGAELYDSRVYGSEAGTPVTTGGQRSTKTPRRACRSRFSGKPIGTGAVLSKKRTMKISPAKTKPASSSAKPYPRWCGSQIGGITASTANSTGTSRVASARRRRR